MYALIENNIVVNIIIADENFVISHNLNAIEIKKDMLVNIGDVVIDGKIQPKDVIKEAL